jgi:hypothetical protein
MKITLLRSYVSKTGTPTFAYTIEGTKEELADYKKVLGENYREDEETKKSLFFGLKRFPDNTELAKKRDGSKFYAVEELLEKDVAREVAKLKALSHVLNSGTKINSRLLSALGISE